MLWKQDKFVHDKHLVVGFMPDAFWLTLMSMFLLPSASSSLFFHILFPFWKRLRMWASSDSRSWNWGGLKSHFVIVISIEIIAKTREQTIATLALTYQLLSQGEISSGCVCSLGSSEPLLYHSGVWCDCWWSYIGNLSMSSAPCWGALVSTLLALLSKALQEGFYTCIRKYCVIFFQG